MILRAMLSSESSGLLYDFIVKEDKKCTHYDRSKENEVKIFGGALNPLCHSYKRNTSYFLSKFCISLILNNIRTIFFFFLLGSFPALSIPTLLARLRTPENFFYVMYFYLKWD